MTITKEKKTKIQTPETHTDIGKQYLDKSNKTSNETTDITSLREQMTTRYNNKLMEAVKKGQKSITGDFYIEICTKTERLIQKAWSNYFFVRYSCPTPFYDQTVYKLNAKEERLEYLWTVPSKKLCKQYYFNKYTLELQSDPLLPYVVDFMEGKLDRKTQILNNELKESTSTH